MQEQFDPDTIQAHTLWHIQTFQTTILRIAAVVFDQQNTLRNIYTVYVLLCLIMYLDTTWFHPYYSGLPHWHWVNHTVPVPVKPPYEICIKHESAKNWQYSRHETKHKKTASISKAFDTINHHIRFFYKLM